MRVIEKLANEAEIKYLNEWEEPRHDFHFGFIAGFLKARKLALQIVQDAGVVGHGDHVSSTLSVLGESKVAEEDVTKV